MSENTTDPWGAAAAGNADADPWGAAPSESAADAESSWLAGGDNVDPGPENTLLSPFQREWIDLETGIEAGLTWVVDNLRFVFQAVKQPVDFALNLFDLALNGVPPFVMIVLFALMAWQASGLRLALASVIGLTFMGAIGIWDEAMTTLSLVITSVLFCMLIGIPAGIWMAKSDRMAGLLRPLLDAMQTTPAFVYLVPIVMLFGIGNVPGVIVTIIFAVPPVIRLTNLGIRQVPADLIEASESFGANSRQLLYRVQLPLAMPTIMAGINQTLMLALSMVVIASMIAVPGLGLMVLRGIGRLDIGLATVGGIGIVILAILLDRMTQALGKDRRERAARRWYETGPAGVVWGAVRRRRQNSIDKLTSKQGDNA